MTSREKALLIVNSVLDNLRDRRPFKNDLRDMEEDAPEIYKVMLEEMADEVEEMIDKE